MFGPGIAQSRTFAVACAAANRNTCYRLAARHVSRRITTLSAADTSAALSASGSASAMDADVEATVRAIHATPAKATIYVTGGGSQALSWLLSVPGASNTVLEVAVPYCRNSLVELLGQEPQQYCSLQTAIDMAKAAYRRSAQLAPMGTPILGVAATCALASEPPKRGEHRAYVAAHAGALTWCWSLTLAKGARSRLQEDSVVSRLLVQALAVASSATAAPLPLHLLQQQHPSAAAALLGPSSTFSPGNSSTGSCGSDAGTIPAPAAAGGLEGVPADGSYSAVGTGGEEVAAAAGSVSASGSSVGGDEAVSSLTCVSTSQQQQQQQAAGGSAAPTANHQHPTASTSTTHAAARPPKPPRRSSTSTPSTSADGSTTPAAATAGGARASPAGPFPTTHHGDVLTTQQIEDPDPIQSLLEGEIRCLEYAGGQVVVDAPRSGRLYLPGSFNPLHMGHEQLLEAAGSVAGDDVEAAFELSVGNADKGRLPKEDVEARVAQFVLDNLPVVLTRAPLFTDKARLLPRSYFVVGWDTANRIVMPKYYGGTEKGMLLEFEKMRAQGCRLLVAGRWDSAGARFKTLTDIQVPAELSDLFSPVPETDFRVDVSSTDLRQKGFTVESRCSSARSSRRSSVVT